MWCGLVLWDRWLPDQPSAERIRIWMSDESPSSAAKAWTAIQPRIPRDATTAAAIDEALDIATFAGWSLRAARTSEMGLVFIDALLEQLRDESAPWRQGMTERRVRALASLGRRDEAYALARDMIAQSPDAPYGHPALASLLLEDNKMDEAREEMARAHDALEKLAAQ
jgi:hypothetical protein